MQKTLSNLSEGQTFKFARLELVKGEETTVGGSKAFVCRSIHFEKYMTLTAPTIVIVEDETVNGLYSSINFTVVVRPVNEAAVAKIIEENDAVIVKHQKDQSKDFFAIEYSFRAKIDKAAIIAKQISEIEEKAKQEGHDFN